jgi:hypothetical protein
MANEKLTMQALIEHDRVQPTLKAPKGSGTSNSSAVESDVKHHQTNKLTILRLKNQIEST